MNKQELENNQRYIADDEIDLVDLLMIIWKRKTMIVVVTLLLTVAAAGISYLMPKVYEVTAILEPAINAKGRFVEKPKTIRANIQAGTYNLSVANSLNLSPEKIPSFKVSILNKTMVKIAIESQNPQHATQILLELLSKVQEKNNATAFIARIPKDEGLKFFKLEKKLLSEQINVLQKIAINTEKRIIDLEALGKAKKTDWTIVVSELLNQQAKLSQLRVELLGLRTQKQRASYEVDKLQSEYVLSTDCTLVKLPTIPDSPIKPKVRLIVALAFVLGLMGSIMLAFMAEFVTKVRQQQAKETVKDAFSR